MVSRRQLLLDLAAGMAALTRTEILVYVGETRVRLLVADKGTGGFIYFHPHENEHGSAVATRHAVREYGGRSIEIRSQGERFITFKLKGKSYSFDPNRMFTEAGLHSSLAHFAPMADAPFECARTLRRAVIELLDDGRRPIVGVHNNGEDSINALSYRKGGALQDQASKVALNPHEQPHNYFLVLDEGLFSRLNKAGFNTVLQSPNAPDDGSLGAYCQQKHWPYINVEADAGDMNQQQRMLAALPAAMA